MNINYKGHKIEIVQDEYAGNPREEFDSASTMACFHNRYELGDKHEFADTDELIEFVQSENVISLPLYLYDHSGITISTAPFSCQWDSGQVGYVYMTRDQAEKENIEFTEEKILPILKGEVSCYDDYLTGRVYGFQTDTGDACSGFYGDREGAIDEAKSMIDYYIQENVKKHAQKLKAQIIKKVPLQYRESLIV